MADETDESRQEPNLELPSLLGFRRKKRGRKNADDATAEVPAAEEPTTMVPPAEAPEVVATPGAEEPDEVEVEETRPIVVTPPPPPPAQTVTPPPPAPEPARPVPEPAPPVPEPDPVPPPAPLPEPDPVPEPQPAFASPAEETAVIPGPGTPEAAHHETVDQEFFQPDPVAGGPGAEQVTAEPLAPPRPIIDPRIAALLSGAIVGLIGMVLATVAGRGCEAVRGVGSCGGLGLLALLVILAVQVLIGAVLLRTARLIDPTSTAFLGVGMMAVIVLLFFLGSLESSWLIVVLPIVTGLTFLLSWWVTETFVDGGGDSAAG